MTPTPPSNDDALPDGGRGPEGRPRGVIAVVEEHDDAPDECTIYPDSDSRRLLTEWVSAEAGSFVSLDEMR
ncbi:DUF7511 domain-containing protein [Halobacterium wangiae]|uniref:DUF7511 domain-containing protein n=1 Tax=Halobacterium wangiae TaxID=2902623 RepID=UPI001E4AF1AA|nr:hypothetical protein [Halobacterium wangiae]